MTREEARGLLMRCEAESYCPHYLQKLNCDGCKQRIALDMAIEALQIDADRLSGEWNYLSGSTGSYMTISCPFCGTTFNDVAEWNYNYCPSCGAIMKGGDIDDE